MMRKQWKIILCVLLAAAVLGGVLALCLWEREPQGDTDPNAPFVDLPARTKKEVLEAVSAYYAWGYPEDYTPIFWHGDDLPHSNDALLTDGDRYRYGVRYYGTFGGYHIVISPIQSVVGMSSDQTIGEYTFVYLDSFVLLAYKEGAVSHLKKVYNDRFLSDKQIGMIYQCYQKYNEEIYKREAWVKYENGQKIRGLLSVCGVTVILAGVGYGACCLGRKRGKRRTKDLQ